jgi:hypothetical protein
LQQQEPWHCGNSGAPREVSEQYGSGGASQEVLEQYGSGGAPREVLEQLQIRDVGMDACNRGCVTSDAPDACESQGCHADVHSQERKSQGRWRGRRGVTADEVLLLPTDQVRSHTVCESARAARASGGKATEAAWVLAPGLQPALSSEPLRAQERGGGTAWEHALALAYGAEMPPALGQHRPRAP